MVIKSEVWLQKLWRKRDVCSDERLKLDKEYRTRSFDSAPNALDAPSAIGYKLLNYSCLLHTGELSHIQGGANQPPAFNSFSRIHTLSSLFV